MHRHVLVLGDQLTRQVGPLAGADPAATSVLMIESLEVDGFGVHYKRSAACPFNSLYWDFIDRHHHTFADHSRRSADNP